MINPTELALDMLPDRVRQQARYVDDVPAPSVIALDCVAAGEAVDHFMLAVTNLHSTNEEHSLSYDSRAAAGT
ncbi:hypothetical protein AB0C38_28955 [Amycolatopsis sp. NPDC048633]|uniref:hypothetical protein n=1 Tax=Amycolatopsis sp. NPDC048633 TaxID=3157095 RepID=UPI0033FB9647